MQNILMHAADKARRVVRNWWLMLLAGLLCIAAGIVVFCFPVESYVALSLFFGIAMLVSGIVQLVLALDSRNYFMTRGYVVAGGIVDLLLGIFLCCKPDLTLMILPFILGFWMLYHSFMIISFADDLSTFGVRGSGWTICGGILLLLLSILILVKPFAIGTSAVVILTGCAFLVAGGDMCYIAFRLKNIHKYINERFKEYGIEDAKIIE
ncbi:MAG: HdeD family acid-resistance protein [Paludibacteraceae bacterium]